MSLNTDSYRSATAFRISQLVDPSISDPVKLHLADVLRGQVEMLINEVERLRAIIARMDEVAPRADDTCDEPGITLSEAVRREFKSNRHRLFAKEAPDV